MLHKTRPGVDQGNSHRLWDESRLRHFCQTWEQSGWLQHPVSGRLCFCLTLYLLINVKEQNINILFRNDFLLETSPPAGRNMILSERNATNSKCHVLEYENLKRNPWVCIFSLQILWCNRRGFGECDHQPARRPGGAAEHVQRWNHPHRTQSGERPARSEGERDS